MATFLTLQQELAAQSGLDQTVAAYATLLQRWLNNAQQMIIRAYEWPFMRSPTPLVVQTVTDITAGTVATVAGSAAITFSAIPVDNNGNQVSVLGRYIQTVSSKDFYKITAHTLGSTSATMEIAAIFTNSAATYTVRKYFYSTSTNVDKIIEISQDILPYQLIETSYEYFQSYNPGFLSSGTPRIYCMQGYDANGTPQFRLWPNPDSVINLTVWYQTVATDLVNNTDVSVIPAKWHTTVLLEGAKAQAFSYLDDTREPQSQQLFAAMIDEMKNEYENSLHRHRVMTAADNQPVGGNLGYMPLPFNYPRNS